MSPLLSAGGGPVSGSLWGPEGKGESSGGGVVALFLSFLALLLEAGVEAVFPFLSFPQGMVETVE